MDSILKFVLSRDFLYGLTIVVFILVTYSQNKHYKILLEYYSKEIDRVSKSRDSLQATLLNDRISTKTPTNELVDKIGVLEKQIEEQPEKELD